jgi:hypothetical protein
VVRNSVWYSSLKTGKLGNYLPEKWQWTEINEKTKEYSNELN